jgi:hypothetical protein
MGKLTALELSIKNNKAIQAVLNKSPREHKQVLVVICVELKIASKTNALSELLDSKKHKELALDIIQSIFPSSNILFNEAIVGLLLDKNIVYEMPEWVQQRIQLLTHPLRPLPVYLNALIKELILAMSIPQENTARYESNIEAIAKIVATQVPKEHLEFYIDFCKSLLKSNTTNRLFAFTFLTLAYHRFPQAVIGAFKNELSLLMHGELLVKKQKEGSGTWSGIATFILNNTPSLDILADMRRAITPQYPQAVYPNLYASLALRDETYRESWPELEKLVFSPPAPAKIVKTARELLQHENDMPKINSIINSEAFKINFLEILNFLINSRVSKKNPIALTFKIIHVLAPQADADVTKAVLRFLSDILPQYLGRIYSLTKNIFYFISKKNSRETIYFIHQLNDAIEEKLLNYVGHHIDEEIAMSLQCEANMEMLACLSAECVEISELSLHFDYCKKNLKNPSLNHRFATYLLKEIYTKYPQEVLTAFQGELALLNFLSLQSLITNQSNAMDKLTAQQEKLIEKDPLIQEIINRKDKKIDSTLILDSVCALLNTPSRETVLSQLIGAETIYCKDLSLIILSNMFPSPDQRFNETVVRLLYEKDIALYNPLWVHEHLIQWCATLFTLPSYVNVFIKQLIESLNSNISDDDDEDEYESDPYEDGMEQMAQTVAARVTAENLDFYFDLCKEVLTDREISSTFAITFLSEIYKRYPMEVQRSFHDCPELLTDSTLLFDMEPGKKSTESNIAKFLLAQHANNILVSKKIKFARKNMKIAEKSSIKETKNNNLPAQYPLFVDETFAQVKNLAQAAYDDETTLALLTSLMPEHCSELHIIKPEQIDILYALIKRIFIKNYKVKNIDLPDSVTSLIYKLEAAIHNRPPIINDDDDDDDDSDTDKEKLKVLRQINSEHTDKKRKICDDDNGASGYYLSTAQAFNNFLANNTTPSGSTPHFSSNNNNSFK